MTYFLDKEHSSSLKVNKVFQVVLHHQLIKSEEDKELSEEEITAHCAE